MKKILEKYDELMKHPKGKAFLFFGVYALFFVALFIFISVKGQKGALLQEYEKGNSSFFQVNNLLSGNFYYDYKITVNGKLNDYYGRMLQNEESFKYNNQDYYKNEDNYYLNQDSLLLVDSPFLFREFVQLDNINAIMSSAFYVSKTEYENGNLDYNYIISNNTLNQILYNENTDYDDVASEICIKTDSNGIISSITYSLDSFCNYRDNCNTLKIELFYELYGEVRDIKKGTL